MSENQEQQAEELDVLKSIYETDEAFTAISDTCFQFKYGSDSSGRSFVLQMSWPEDYPMTAVPVLSLDLFYNKHLMDNVRSNILHRLNQEATDNLGMASTFTLIEHVKENLEDLLADQPETRTVQTDHTSAENSVQDSKADSKANQKKDTQLTKNQKRRMWDKGGLENDDRVRGWDWIDVIKHLSQTGGQQHT